MSSSGPSGRSAGRRPLTRPKTIRALPATTSTSPAPATPAPTAATASPAPWQQVTTGTSAASRPTATELVVETGAVHITRGKDSLVLQAGEKITVLPDPMTPMSSSDARNWTAFR